MRTLIGLAAVLHVATAEAECSDPLACGQRTSLMQMKSVNTKQSNDGSMHSTLMYFQTFTQKLVQQFHARRAAQAPVHQDILETDTSNQDHIARDADGDKKFVKLADATHAKWSTATDDNTYDKTTLDTVRNVMDTIRQTLLGALIQNLDNALVRVGQCQLLEAYDGAKLQGHKGYHVGYFHPLPQDGGYGTNTPHKRRMRKRISDTALTGDKWIANRESEVNTDGGIAGNISWGAFTGLTWDQREMGQVQTVHQFCFQETFTETDLGHLDGLWGDSESERISHKTCRTDRKTSCVGEKKPHCEAYDNYRWYDPAARLETHACTMYDNDPLSDNFGTSYTASHAEVFRVHLSATDDRKVNQMEACLRGTKTWLEDLYTYYKHCNRQGTDECHDRREVCDAKQHDFEVARCWWAVDHDYHCTSYEHCVKNRLTACVGVCEDLTDYLASTKRDYSTGETIQCLLEALFGRYNTAYNKDALPYLKADGTATDDETLSVGRNDVAWPLVPRGETDDEKKLWLDWCSGAQADVRAYDASGLNTTLATSKSATIVLDRYYHNNPKEYPWYTGPLGDTAGEVAARVAAVALLESVTFTDIKNYEADYFTVRCRGGSRLRNARRHQSSTLTITHAECSGPPPSGHTNTGTDNPALPTSGWNPWECFEAFSDKATVNSNFGLDRSDFVDNGAWSWSNPSEDTAGTAGDKYDLWPQRTTNQRTESVVTTSLDGTETTTVLTISSAAAIRPSETSGMGTVLYLTYLEKYHALSNAKASVRLFDCSQEPVPGEWTQQGSGATAQGCLTPPPDDSNRYTWSESSENLKNISASQTLSSWPHFGCFADVYRVDRLRTDVPVCDVDVDGQRTFWLSHASNLKYGVVDNSLMDSTDANSPAKNPDGLGCGNAENIRAADTGAAYEGAGYTNNADLVDHSDRVEMRGQVQFACVEVAHDAKAGTWSDDADLYGTCCDTDQYSTFWEPIPAANCGISCTPRSQYACKNQYMFTYAERELALGLTGRGFHSGDAYADAKGFFKAQRHNLIADTYGDTTASLDAATSKDVSEGEFDSTHSLRTTPWSLSSDIQGAYKVVSTTASLGTACTFRFAATHSDSAKYVTADGGWNAGNGTNIDAKAVRSSSTPGTNGGHSGIYRYQDHTGYSGENL